MTEQKKHLTKSDRFKVMLRSQFLQGSWNYERMQNGGWAYSLIPALKNCIHNVMRLLQPSNVTLNSSTLTHTLRLQS